MPYGRYTPGCECCKAGCFDSACKLTHIDADNSGLTFTPLPGTGNGSWTDNGDGTYTVNGGAGGSDWIRITGFGNQSPGYWYTINTTVRYRISAPSMRSGQVVAGRRFVLKGKAYHTLQEDTFEYFSGATSNLPRAETKDDPEWFDDRCTKLKRQWEINDSSWGIDVKFFGEVTVGESDRAYSELVWWESLLHIRWEFDDANVDEGVKLVWSEDPTGDFSLVDPSGDGTLTLYQELLTGVGSTPPCKYIGDNTTNIFYFDTGTETLAGIPMFMEQLHDELYQVFPTWGAGGGGPEDPEPPSLDLNADARSYPHLVIPFWHKPTEVTPGVPNPHRVIVEYMPDPKFENGSTKPTGFNGFETPETFVRVGAKAWRYTGNLFPHTWEVVSIVDATEMPDSVTLTRVK